VASPSHPPSRTHRQRVASRDGYFAPESVIRRVGNEPLVPLLGGGPAVLLQVAHPLVASGIVRHSAFEDDLWKRFMRTMEALYLVVYGSRFEAERAGEIVRAVHGRVCGRTDEPLGPFPAGTAYSAADPELMLWVHATLVETSLAVVQRFAAPLTEPEQEAYYREMGVVARAFGVPSTVIPRRLADFREYVADRLGGPEIVVTAPAQDVARAILRAPLPGLLRVAVPVHRLATAAFLPERLRAEYGLCWSSAHAATLELSARPLRLAAMAHFRAAERVAPSPSLEPPVDSLAAQRRAQRSTPACAGRRKVALSHRFDEEVLMADTARSVEYYYVTIPDAPGEGQRILSALKDSGVNLLAFLGFPLGGGESQIDLVPEDPQSLKEAAGQAGVTLSEAKRAFLIEGDDRVGAVADTTAKLADANINLTAAAAAGAGSGRFGMILWVADADYERAAEALGA
jgi:uncharacterized protein (DUF2236 family)